jgi:acyl-coenzyme A thioesterase PaaI-like protein
VASKSEISAFLARDFPQTRCTVLEVGLRAATVRQAVGEEDLRPGGTVSGPTLMGIADVALYIAILGEIGIVPLAVTTSFSINFLRKPASDRAIIGSCELLKVGRSLIVGEVKLYSEGHADLIAHAVATYSVPKTVTVSGG